LREYTKSAKFTVLSVGLMLKNQIIMAI